MKPFWVKHLLNACIYIIGLNDVIRIGNILYDVIVTVAILMPG